MPRTDFTPSQRAAIFSRDRATCCFSGANLWLLDTPLRPGFQIDWADHVKPSARGGHSDIENGVCSSHTFNAKKRHNSADNCYLFSSGLPTSIYFDIFGLLPPFQTARLRRLENLRPADWFFNRALGSILIGFDYRCRLERYDERPVRDDAYWFAAAFRKLRDFQSISCPSLEERKIVVNPTDIQRHWLALRDVESIGQLQARLRPLYASYRANFRVWARYFFDAETRTARKAALMSAEKAKGLNGDTLSCIRADFEFSSSENPPG